LALLALFSWFDTQIDPGEACQEQRQCWIPNCIGDRLDAFIGVWSEQEEQEFNATVAAVEQIDGLDHRFSQHPPLHRYQPWQAGFPVDCYGPTDDHGRKNLDCASQAPLHPGYVGYQLWQAGSPADCYGRNDDHGPAFSAFSAVQSLAGG
jgi:hypothetical protein